LRQDEYFAVGSVVYSLCSLYCYSLSENGVKLSTLATVMLKDDELDISNDGVPKGY